MNDDCESYACATQGCGHTIHLHHDLERRYRDTQEDFYCPAGHANYFPKKRGDEVARLKRQVELLQRTRDRFRDLWDEAIENNADLKLAVKSCPFDCGFRVVRKSKPENIRLSLAAHIVEAHGATYPPYVPELEDVAV